ncbi:MAG TPA: regulatory iron-sulfur-containing complex subunit RicT [bacterium]|nr:regulatory iron-sulfur-containing complex subunit RicT [bacterium]
MKLRCVEVRFDYLNRAYMFENDEHELKLGDVVVVETDFGLDIGKVIHEMDEREVSEEELPLKKILRPVNDEDMEKMISMESKQEQALEICEEEVANAQLGMKLVNARYTFDGSKVTICYTADGRVDFRELVKKLASRLRTRIELRQVGVRDEARLFGGIGPCGRTLCCAGFMKEFQSVSIKMAKEQGLPLNPMKISGICGRLFCCLKHEYEYYLQMKEQLPEVGHEIKQGDVKGKVITVNVLKHSVEIVTNEGGRLWVELPEPKFDPTKCHDDAVPAVDEELTLNGNVEEY